MQSNYSQFTPKKRPPLYKNQPVYTVRNVCNHIVRHDAHPPHSTNYPHASLVGGLTASLCGSSYGGRKVAICFSGIRKAEKQILWLIYMSFSPFLLPENQIERFVKMHVLRFYFSVTRKAGFTLSPNAGGRKVAICMSATRIVEKQI